MKKIQKFLKNMFPKDTIVFLGLLSVSAVVLQDTRWYVISIYLMVLWANHKGMYKWGQKEAEE